MRRVVLLLLVGTFAFLGSAEPLATADTRGSDPFSSLVNPAIEGGMASQYPTASYQLDTYVDDGVLGTGGWDAKLAGFFTNCIWMAILWGIVFVSELFSWAFNLDLLNGPHGALKSVAASMEQLQDKVFGDQVFFLAITITGVWCIWQILRERNMKAVAIVIKKLVLITVALAFILHAVPVYGTVSSFVNTASVSILSAAKQGTINDPDAAKLAIKDRIFENMVVKPWAVLQFGGLSNCVDTDNLDEDGFPAWVTPVSPKRDICRSVLKQGKDGHGGYAWRFLDQAPGSDEREAEFNSLNKGEVDLPTPRRGDSNQEERQQFAGYAIDKADSPAVDMMQGGHAFIRLGMAVVFFIGTLFFLALFARLSFAIILMAVVALLLLLLAPVALIAAALPFKQSDGFFEWWVSRMAITLCAKIAFSILITIMLITTSAIMAAAIVMGFLIAFVVNGCLWFLVYKHRGDIASWIGVKSVGVEGRLPSSVQKHYKQTSAIVTAGIAAPVAALGGAVAGWKVKDDVQEPAKAPSGKPPVDPPPVDDGVQEPAKQPAEVEQPPAVIEGSTSTGDQVTLTSS